MSIQVYIIRKKVGKGKRRKTLYRLRWQEPYVGPDGALLLRWRQEATHTTDKLTAKAFRDRKLKELNGLAVDGELVPAVKISQLEAIDKLWLENRNRAEKTIYLSCFALKRFREIIGDIALHEIGPAHIERFISARTNPTDEGKKGIGALSIHRELRGLRAAFARAKKEHKLIKQDPFAEIEMPAIPEPKVRPFTPEEERRLLDACAGDLEVDCYVRLALDTGCRANEISHLTWDNVDLNECTARVVCTATWRTKTRRDRMIAFTPETAARLRQWREWRKGKPMIFDEEGAGQRDHYNRIRDKYERVASSIGLDKTFQNMRQTVGCLLARQKVNEKAAAAYLGHTNVATTAKYYQTVGDETIKAMGRSLRKTGTT
jgi:integrase